MSRRADAVIVGAGIVGAACAHELAVAGLRVLVLEAAPRTAGGATAAGMGHIIVLDDSETEWAFTRWCQVLWDAMAPQMPASVQRDACGALWIAADEQELAAVQAKVEFCEHHDMPAFPLDGRSLYEAEPRLRPGLPGGALLPEDSVVYPPAFAAWLLDDAPGHRHQIQVRTGACVAGVDDGVVRLASGESIEAGWVINAAGHRALELLPEPLPWVTIRPRKGHLAITDRAPGFLRHQLIELGYLKSAHGHESTSVAFNAQPRRTGQVLIGSSRQYDTHDTAVEPAVLARMLGRALWFLPELAQLNVLRTWAGLRAATQDKLPIIGPAPGRPRLLMAAGHEGLGITTSLGTGRLIAAHVTGVVPTLDPAPFAADRRGQRAA